MARDNRYSTDFLDRIRAAIPLSTYVSEFVTLKKVGRRLAGRCPLHADTAPSFYVNDEDGLFYCFGCKKGGDLFRFVMEQEGIQFMEAVEVLADRAGIPMPARGLAGPVKASPRDRILKINEMANKVYRDSLKGPDGRGLAYLEKRGITAETIEAFELGLTPQGWDPVLRELSRLGVKPEHLEEAGLVKRRPSGGGFYDRFRGRVMIPIRSRHGKLIAFGGRLIAPAEGQEEPKYLNSPETPIYVKGKTLFGLYQAKEAIRAAGAVIIVEGYFDMIRLFQEGIHNVAASLGTALTREQLKLLSGLAERIYVGYDSDAAGLEASLRAVPECLEEGFSVRVIRHPGGLDPDDCVAGYGADAYRKLVEAAQDLPAFLTSRDVAKGDLADPEQAPRALQRILPVLARVSSPLLRAQLASRIAEAARTEESVVLAEIKGAARARHGAPLAARQGSPLAGVTPTIAEIHLLKMFIESNDVRARLLPELQDELLEGLPSAPVFRALRVLSAAGNDFSVHTVIESVAGGEDPGMLATVMLAEAEVSESHARECLNTLKRRFIVGRMKALQSTLSHGPLDAAGADAVLREKMELQKLRDTLEQEPQRE